MGKLSIGKLAIQLTTQLLRKPCKLFASVARVCQRQLAFLVILRAVPQDTSQQSSAVDASEPVASL